MSLGNVVKMYKTISEYPFGKTIFSYVFSFQAPYFLNIRPYVEDLKPGLGIFLFLKTILIHL
jgi:hypothetical protein